MLKTTKKLLFLFLINIFIVTGSVWASDFEMLPENQVTTSYDGSFRAFYAKPTNQYGHAILGDGIEATQLVVERIVTDSVDRENFVYQYTLPRSYVFEDIAPRLVDVDNDKIPEMVTIRTDVNKGAGIAIYKLVNEALTEFAYVPVIGKQNRWLNIVAIYDLDNDGVMELAWIETPHIGGKLKVAKIQRGVIQAIDEAKYYSNHAIGERNLCLSVIVSEDSKIKFFVPNQKRNKIVGFVFDGEHSIITDEISVNVDFSKPLQQQYPFKGLVETSYRCIVD